MTAASVVLATIGVALFGQLGDPPDPPAAINYQGTLKQSDGANLSNGDYVLEFRIYDAPDATANVLWGKEYDISIVGGRFNVILSDSDGAVTNDAPASSLHDVFDGTDRFLGITVAATIDGGGTRVPIAGAAEIGPRQQMLSAPFAVTALHATSTQNIVPPGTIVPFAGQTAPPGWVLCDGAAYDGNDPEFQNLFATIGNTWGGAGAGNFQVPSLGGRTLIGAGAGVLALDAALGDTGGSETVTLTVGQMPAHTHQYNDVRRGTENVAAVQGGGNGIGSNSSSDPERTTASTGGGEAHPNMQPWAAVNYIIKL